MAEQPRSDGDVAAKLERYETAGSVNMTKEMFEALYLTPQNPVKGELRNTFGNPTPFALLGFLITATPLGVGLMGWRGSGGGGAAIIGVIYFFGGLLQIIGAIMEWIIGNTFPFVVFGTYGAFWLTLGATLQPQFNAVGSYSPGGLNAAAGVGQFYSSYAFYLLFLSLLTAMFMVCSLRINVVFLIIFLFLTIALDLLAGAYWKLADGAVAAAENLQVAAGACVFIFCAAGWYLLFGQLLQSVDFPLTLPVGDLSSRFKGARSRERTKGQAA